MSRPAKPERKSRESKPLREAATKIKGKAPAPAQQSVDDSPEPMVQSGFSVFNPIPVKDTMMSTVDAEKAKTNQAERKELAEKARAEKLAAKELKASELAAAKAANAAVKAEAKAAKEKEKAEKAAARAAAKAEREARLAELGPQAKMIALREAKKGYVKSATGVLRSDDDLGRALDAVPSTAVVTLAMEVLGLTANPYQSLNIGQQSMNLRNKLRGAIKRGVVTIEQVVAARDAGGHAIPIHEIEAAAAAKAEREAKRAENAAARAAKVAAKQASDADLVEQLELLTA